MHSVLLVWHQHVHTSVHKSGLQLHVQAGPPPKTARQAQLFQNGSHCRSDLAVCIPCSHRVIQVT